MKNNKIPPMITDADKGTAVSVVGDTYRILLSGKQTNGAFAIMDFLVPPGGGPGPHSHADIVESFYVVEGEIEFKSEAGVHTATKGSFVSIPKGGIVHQFKNKSNSIAHMVCTVFPAGLDDFFLEIGQPIEVGSFLPPPEMDHDTIEKLLATARRYGQEVFPPDYLDK